MMCVCAKTFSEMAKYKTLKDAEKLEILRKPLPL